LNKKGSVLIIGGGVAGIQAALDLAEGGIKVYLVEKKSSIGGTMAQLDKTFPTNDCSMCILSPKMVETGRHLNIKLLTNAQVLSVDGKPGNFKVRIKKNARYVDIEKCKGCGDCSKACPVDVLSSYEENLATRKAIYREFDQAVPGAFIIEKKGTPPCKAACPIHLNAHGYVMAVKAGEMERAREIVREEKNFVFAATAARVCTHPCEKECKRREVDDEPVAIRRIKRFITDWEFEKYKGPKIDKSIQEEKGKRVAIIGAGPAGLSAAFDLRKKGYKVTVYEALPKGGGMLLTGIPAYRLPKEILEKEVKVVEEMVEMRYNTKIDKKLFEKIVKDYDAVFVATGAHRSRSMRIPGEDLEGVYHAVEVLKKINFGEKVELGKKVMVVGGGNSAMDAARSALRLGAKVVVAYRRSRKEMPAIPEEVEAAEKEGIEFHFLRNPVEFIGEEKRLKKVKLIKMELGEPDESGRRRPVPIPGSEYEVEVDSILLAIGEKPDLSFITDEIELTDWGTIKVDELTLQSSLSKVFAGGDCVTGPATFIEAIAHGKRAAISIDRFLSGKDLRKGREHELPFKSELTGDKERAYTKKRLEAREIPLEERVSSFKEVEKSPSADDVKEEAKRCINCSVCSECMLCVTACEPEAIVHEDEEKIEEIEVGAIILAPGFDEFEPLVISEYGFRRYKNVVTSIQFERILCASGPFGGEVRRPSDGRHPKKIAWIQCVGSRDKRNPYCSSVCCMYAVKEAVIAKEHAKDIQPTIFFMDIRSYGKDFDKYVERAKKEYGIRFVYARPGSIEEDEETKDLILTYEEEGRLKRERFDMVVLSVGLKPPKDYKELQEIFKIGVDEYGFVKTSSFSPIEIREGVYVAGAFEGPKDIPESVAQASAAAGKVQEFLSQVRNSEIEIKEFPPERNVFGEPLRIGVFVCHCGINIGGVVNVKEVVEFAKKLPGVVYATDNLYTCSADTQEKIKEIIKEHRLNRVVVAACTPRTHEPLFQSTIREAGLNRYLFEMANIRDQNSWVHMDLPKDATEKAKDLVRMAVAKARKLKPLETKQIPVNKKALIIGGGIAGMTAAKGIAEAGFEVFLVEKNSFLGGNATKIYHTIDNEDVTKFLKKLIQEIEKHPKIKIFKNTTVERVEGFVGNFVSELSNKEKIEHGVTIIATGAEEYEPKEYLYQEDERVITQRRLEEILEKNDKWENKIVVMIQCVGSRNEEHPYCSRVCCTEAVKNALKIKEKYPETEVFVLFRDIRTYGKKEPYYELARSKGVIFLRFSEDNPPEVIKENGRLFVKFFDKILEREVSITPDLLVLSAGIVPSHENNKIISKLYKIPLHEDGFFLEAHMKLRPVDFATEGVYLCGLAHGPKFIDEAIAQAEATVARALLILNKDYIETEGKIARVNERTCVGCGFCAEVCPYQAIELKEKNVLGYKKTVAQVNEALCKGCGNCASSCRSNSIDLDGFANVELVSAFEELLTEEV